MCRGPALPTTRTRDSAAGPGTTTHTRDRAAAPRSACWASLRRGWVLSPSLGCNIGMSPTTCCAIPKPISVIARSLVDRLVRVLVHENTIQATKDSAAGLKTRAGATRNSVAGPRTRGGATTWGQGKTSTLSPKKLRGGDESWSLRPKSVTYVEITIHSTDPPSDRRTHQP